MHELFLLFRLLQLKIDVMVFMIHLNICIKNNTVLVQTNNFIQNFLWDPRVSSGIKQFIKLSIDTPSRV